MTSTQTLPSAVVDIEDRGDVIEKAQREYAAAHGIELTEDEFALAKAGELVRIERLGLPATEARLVDCARAGVRHVANGSHRRRPLSVLDLIAVWGLPLFSALVTGCGLWAVWDLRQSVVTAQYPSWLPGEIIEALPGNMEFFGFAIGTLGGLATVVAAIAAAAATWRTQTYQNALSVAKVTAIVTAFVLLAFVAAATMWGTGMVNLPNAGGGQ